MLNQAPMWEFGSDVWSAGLVFCELLFGIEPFSGIDNHSELLKMINQFNKKKGLSFGSKKRTSTLEYCFSFDPWNVADKS